MSVTVASSSDQWRSDGFKFRRRNGEPLRVSFIVNDVMLAAMENRLIRSPNRVAERQWLGYTANDTRRFARSVGLKPLTTRVCSPKTNGMAESFVKMAKRDYFTFMPKPDAANDARNLSFAFEHIQQSIPIAR